MVELSVMVLNFYLHMLKQLFPKSLLSPEKWASYISTLYISVHKCCSMHMSTFNESEWIIVWDINNSGSPNMFFSNPRFLVFECNSSLKPANNVFSVLKPVICQGLIWHAACLVRQKREERIIRFIATKSL